MKSFAILALAGFAAAQSLNDLPTCGQTCINNMIAIANSAFGCSQGDVRCYCNNARFGYGVRDCSNQACSSSEDANRVIAYGLNYCANIAGDNPSASGGNSQAPATTGAFPILSSALESASAFPTPSGSAGSAITSAASSVSGAVSSAASAASSGLSGASSVVSSVQSSVNSELSSAVSSALSSAGSALSSVLSGTNGSPTNSAGETTGTAGAGPQDTGAAAMATGMPVAGIAGLAAWLLL